MRCKVHFLLAAAISFLSQTFLTEARDGKQVLLVSMDGFRHDYFEKAKTPNFDAMKKSGATVPYVTPPFVPEAFPSHHSMATGLYPESHGMVANSFYDPLYDEVFNKAKNDYKWWNGSEPIWVKAVKAGLSVGAFNWPGTDVNFDGYRPSAYRRYRSDVAYDIRIRTVIDWLAWMDYDLCLLYFEEPDKTAHMVGPDDPHLIPVIEKMDNVLGWLMTSLETAGIKDQVDVIVTSDHGMAQVHNKNEALKLNEVENFMSLQTVVSDLPAVGAMMHLFARLTRRKLYVEALSKFEHLNVHVRHHMPERFHYNKNSRIGPLVAMADEGWVLTSPFVSNTQRGMHGYDNNMTSMRTIFVASGPSFIQGYRLKDPIETVDIYPLLCCLLKLKPSANNGSLARIGPVLSDNSALHKATAASSFIITSSWVILTRVL